MKKKKILSIIITIFSVILILPIIVTSLIGINVISTTKEDVGNTEVWYYIDDNGQETEYNFDFSFDVKKNIEYSIYTYLNLNEGDDTLFIDSIKQRVKVYIEDELIYDNNTENKIFSKAEQSKFHTITLPENCNNKKLTITYSTPYEVFSGDVNKVYISSRKEVVDSMFLDNLLYLMLPLIFICSAISLFVSSFLFLSKYGEFRRMNVILLASIFLSGFFVFESKILPIFAHGYLSNISYVSLILYNIFVVLFMKIESKKKSDQIYALILLIINISHLLISCLLQVFNVVDLFETLFISLLLVIINLFFFVYMKVSKFINCKKNNTLRTINYYETITAILLFLAELTVMIVNYKNTNLYLISASLFIVIVYVKYSMSLNEVVLSAKKSVEYESELKETKNYLINSQMKSHFVFNTLGAIRTMIVSHPKMAYDMTTDFTKYLRANISNTTSTDLISFEQELDHIKAYLNIELKRFQNRLKVKYDINVTDFKIPPLSVEPLVENAVKHGVCKKIKGGTVNIITKENNEYIYIIIEDDGAGFDVDTLEEAGKNGHVGLRYIKTRLKQLADADFEIVSKVKEGTKATITIKK